MNIFYYFTGTGNTLDAAKRIAAQLGDTKLVRISAETKPEDLHPYERIGFFLPTYIGNAPQFAIDFIKTLKIPADAYVFSVATCGGNEIGTHHTVQKTVESCGGKVSAFFTIKYPANNQTWYAPPSKEKAIEEVQADATPLAHAAEIIAAKRRNHLTENPLLKILLKPVRTLTIGKGSDSHFYASDACIGCSTCTRVCPTENITMKDHKPCWHHDCTRCTACMQLCPKHAINFGGWTKHWGRYQNPNIKLKDLLVSKPKPKKVVAKANEAQKVIS